MCDECPDLPSCGSESCPCPQCSYWGCCCEARVEAGELAECNRCTGLGCFPPDCTKITCPNFCCCAESWHMCFNDCIAAGGDVRDCSRDCTALCSETSRWACDGASKTCYQDARLNPDEGFATKTECEQSFGCKVTVPTPFSCINGRCIAQDTTGEYDSYDSCKEFCGSYSCDVSSLNCIFHGDVEINPSLGNYGTRSACQIKCPEKYSCNGVTCIVDDTSTLTIDQCKQICGTYTCNRTSEVCSFTYENFTGYSDLDQCRMNCETTFCCAQSCPCTRFCTTNECGKRTLFDCQGKPTFSDLNSCKSLSTCCGDSRHYACVNKVGQTGDAPGTRQCVEVIGPYTGVPGTYQTLTGCNSDCGNSWYCNSCNCAVKKGLNGTETEPQCKLNCQELTYRCDMGKCVQDVCGGGMTLTECENQCFRWRCDVSTPQTSRTPCTKYPNTAIGYLTETDCLDNTFCNTTPRYKCQVTTCPNNPSKPLSRTCVETYEEGPGTYSSVWDCINVGGCGSITTSTTYNCNGNKCVSVNYCDDQYPGLFTELKGPLGCEENCWGWGCNNNICSQIESVPNNHENCASTCHCKWKKQRIVANGCTVCTKLCGVALGADNPLCDQWGANCAPSPNYFDTELDCTNSIYNNNEGRFACLFEGGCQREEDVLDTSKICSIHCNRQKCISSCKSSIGYNCVAGKCTENTSCNEPQYRTLEDCKRICEYTPPVGYNCVLRNTVPFPGGKPLETYQCVPSLIRTDDEGGSQTLPEFPTLGLCRTFCLNTGVRGWYCDGNDCLLAKSSQEINGKTTFATYAECAVSCIIPNQSPCGNTPIRQQSNVNSGFNYTQRLNNG